MFEKELEILESESMLRRLPDDVPADMINLASNDYLGINDNLNLVKQFWSEVEPTAGLMSSCSSRLLTGNHKAYRDLEAQIDELFGRKSLVFSSGFHANQGFMQSIVGKGDLILADKLVHASIIDGFRLTEAEVVRFAHLDNEHLRRFLQQKRANYKRCLIVTEGLFSMNGDMPDLKAMVALKREFDAWLYVDEAHSFGVRGARGLGMSEEQGVKDEVDFIMCTLGKALASYGAFVVCDSDVREWLVNKCRTVIFTTGLSPIQCLWSQYTIRQMLTMDSERRNLTGLWKKMGERLNMETFSHIVPYTTGSSESAVKLALKLQQHGFYVLPIRHPTVPKGKECVRLSLKANLTEATIEKVTRLLAE